MKREGSRVKVKRGSRKERNRRERERGEEEEVEKPQGRLSLFVFPLPSTG